MQIVPLRYLSYRYKKSVLWPSKYAKIRFRPGLCPNHAGRAHDAPPDPHSRLERGHPSPYPTPFGTDPPSVRAMSQLPKLCKKIAYMHRIFNICLVPRPIDTYTGPETNVALWRTTSQLSAHVNYIRMDKCFNCILSVNTQVLFRYSIMLP